MRFANVAIPSPIRGALTYAVPAGLDIVPGMRVAAPFRNRRMIGVVLQNLDELPPELKGKPIKEIFEPLDESPVMDGKLLELISWMASYYCTPIGEAVKAALPARLMKEGSPKTTRPSTPHEMRPSQFAEIELNADQRTAVETISAGFGSHEVVLLHGITGSGKTEVYLSAFERLAEIGKEALLLVPEIGLTSQLTARARARFGERVAVYHSGLTDAQRHEQWLRMRAGDVDVVIGTRSAVFAPLRNLGAIVVDEEHDSSYKQDEGFSYHGRDSAVMRAHIEGISAVLGSATPSLESITNAKRGKYRIISLPSRAGPASLPTIDVVDMRIRDRDDEEGIARQLSSLSPKLHAAISENLERGEQTLLFLGRRGFSALHCAGCGEAIRCPNCEIALTAHMSAGSEKLVCHYCDYTIGYPRGCPACGEESLAPIGQGTQRLEAEIADFFPDARVARLDSDMAASPKERRKIFDGMNSGAIDILVGTQMVTKGHDFPNVTLVGVISADQTLHLPDFRAAERTFQLMTQVAGRAGRATRPGHVIIQTFEPDHPSIEFSLSHDFESFASMELESRKALFYPPFSRLANLRFSSLEEGLARGAAERAAETIGADPASEGIRILGPAPAPIAKLRGRFRWQLLLKTPGAGQMVRLMGSALPKMERNLPKKVRLGVDIDPTNLL